MKLSSIERSLAPVVLSSFAPLALPNGFSIGVNEVDWISGLERFLKTASDKARLGIAVALVAFFFSPLFVLGRFHTLAKASNQERAAAMERLLDHRFFLVREMALLVKLVACMAMFRVTSLRERTGYDDPGHDARGETSKTPRVQLHVLAA
jgi:hypothetical protein